MQSNRRMPGESSGEMGDPFTLSNLDGQLGAPALPTPQHRPAGRNESCKICKYMENLQRLWV